MSRMAHRTLRPTGDCTACGDRAARPCDQATGMAATTDRERQAEAVGLFIVLCRKGWMRCAARSPGVRGWSPTRPRFSGRSMKRRSGSITAPSNFQTATVRDGHYLSARWPGDAHRFASEFAAMIGWPHSPPAPRNPPRDPRSGRSVVSPSKYGWTFVTGLGCSRRIQPYPWLGLAGKNVLTASNSCKLPLR